MPEISVALSEGAAFEKRIGAGGPCLTAQGYRLPDALGYLLQRNARLMTILAEEAFARGSRLSFAQFISLMLLRDGLVETPGGLSRLVERNSGSMTRILDQLERDGFILRERSLVDRRSVKIVLTANGRHVTERLLPRLIDMWNDVLADFDAAEYGELVRLQKKLLKSLETAASRKAA